MRVAGLVLAILPLVFVVSCGGSAFVWRSGGSTDAAVDQSGSSSAPLATVGIVPKADRAKEQRRRVLPSRRGPSERTAGRT